MMPAIFWSSPKCAKQKRMKDIQNSMFFFVSQYSLTPTWGIISFSLSNWTWETAAALIVDEVDSSTFTHSISGSLSPPDPSPRKQSAPTLCSRSPQPLCRQRRNRRQGWEHNQQCNWGWIWLPEWGPHRRTWVLCWCVHGQRLCVWMRDIFGWVVDVGCPEEMSLLGSFGGCWVSCWSWLGALMILDVLMVRLVFFKRRGKSRTIYLRCLVAMMLVRGFWKLGVFYQRIYGVWVCMICQAREIRRYGDRFSFS